MDGKFNLLINVFAKKVEEDTIKDLHDRDLACESNLNDARTYVRPGKKYTKVDVGHSGRYMVDNETGEIFGIKAYGQVHKGHAYGTLETIENYFWGRYYPTKIK